MHWTAEAPRSHVHAVLSGVSIRICGAPGNEAFHTGRVRVYERPEQPCSALADAFGNVLKYNCKLAFALFAWLLDCPRVNKCLDAF